VASPALQYFSTLSHKRHDFRGKKRYWAQNVFLIISTISVWSIFHSKKNRVRYDQKCKLVFMQSPRYTCNILIVLQFSRKIFRKYSYITFHENPSSGCRDVPYGWTDRETDTKLVVALRDFVNGSKNELCYRGSFIFACSSSSNKPFWLENSRAFLCVFTVAN